MKQIFNQLNREQTAVYAAEECLLIQIKQNHLDITPKLLLVLYFPNEQKKIINPIHS